MYTHPPDAIVVVDRELRIRYNYGLCLKREDVKKKKRKRKRKKKSVSSLPYIVQSRRELELHAVVVNVGVVAVFCLFHFALLIFYKDSQFLHRLRIFTMTVWCLVDVSKGNCSHFVSYTV